MISANQRPRPVSRMTVVTVKKKVTNTALQKLEPRLPGGQEIVVPLGP